MIILIPNSVQYRCRLANFRVFIKSLSQQFSLSLYNQHVSVVSVEAYICMS